jgi:hypothetical protein
MGGIEDRLKQLRRQFAIDDMMRDVEAVCCFDRMWRAGSNRERSELLRRPEIKRIRDLWKEATA